METESQNTKQNQIYSNQQIRDNLLYGELMTEINKLYVAHGSPERDNEETRSTTTGDYKPHFWDDADGYIRDWFSDEDGDEYDDVIDWGCRWYEELLDGVAIPINGIRYYYSHLTDEFREFHSEAEELIDDWLTEDGNIIGTLYDILIENDLLTTNQGS